MQRESHEQNRRSWNLVIPAHDSHKRDQAGFLRAGGSTLFPEELELLGVTGVGGLGSPGERVLADMSPETGLLAGRDLLHLQCNVGQDTLSLARLGARVTGVDISDEAIARARTLAHEAELLTPSGWQAGITDFTNPQPCHEFQWTVADWLGAVLKAGLVLEQIRDYPYANGYQVFDAMRPLPGKRFAMPAGAPDLPLMCGFVARKPG